MGAMKTTALLCSLALAPLLGGFGCAIAIGNDVQADGGGPDVDRAVCVLRGTAGNESVHGVVTFEGRSGGVLVRARVEGLTPGEHGFHVHQWGDVDCPDGKCTGGHFDPFGEPHGAPDAPLRHVGDLGNLVAGPDGVADYERLDSRLRLEGPNSIVGRAVVVHAGPDDFSSQPSGAAGPRVAVGVIGIAPPE